MEGMISNVYGTEWQAGGPAETPLGYIDENVEYQTTVSVTAGSTSINNLILIDGAYEVRIDRIAFDIFGQANATGYAARFRGGDGRLLNTDFMQITPVQVQDPTICLPLPIAFAPGESFQVDLRNDNAGTLVIQVMIRGIRRRPAAPGEASGVTCQNFRPMFLRYPTPPPGCHFEDYDYYFQYSVTALQQLFQLPLTMDPDADFLLRCLPAHPYGSHRIKVRLTDADANVMMSALVFQDSIFGANGKGSPVWPEKKFPANSTPYLDYQEVSNSSGTLDVILRGLKVVQGEC